MAFLFTRCLHRMDYRRSTWAVVHLFHYVGTLFVVPFIIMSVNYSRVSYALWQSISKAASLSGGDGSGSK